MAINLDGLKSATKDVFYDWKTFYASLTITGTEEELKRLKSVWESEVKHYYESSLLALEESLFE